MKSYILNAQGFLLFSMISVCLLSAVVYVLVTLNKKYSPRFLFWRYGSQLVTIFWKVMETIGSRELLENMYHQRGTLRCQCPAWFPIDSASYMLTQCSWLHACFLTMRECILKQDSGWVCEFLFMKHLTDGEKPSIKWGVPFGGGPEINRSQGKAVSATCLPAFTACWWMILFSNDVRPQLPQIQTRTVKTTDSPGFFQVLRIWLGELCGLVRYWVFSLCSVYKAFLVLLRCIGYMPFL